MCDDRKDQDKEYKLYACAIREQLEWEQRKSAAIHQQASRLPVMQTLFFPALYTIIPQLNDVVNVPETVLWGIMACLLIVGIVGIIFTLLAQWRFSTKDVVDLNDVEKFIKDYHSLNESDRATDLEINYTISLLCQQLNALIEINQKRSRLLHIAMWLFMATLGGTLLFVVVLCVGG